MSGCCGQSPVVISGPTPSRVDVETEILCDVLADGTVAATVLLEPVYDTTSGARVGTRTVDPATGAAYTVQGTLQTCSTAPPCQTCETLPLCDTAADGTVTRFLRTICRNCAGAVTSTTDTALDGTTGYTVQGTVGDCQDCPTTCEALILCDDGADAPATIRGNGVSTGALSNGITWTSNNPGTAGTPQPSRKDTSDGAWWGLHSFPNAVTAPTRWTFSRPATVEFSVYLNYLANPAQPDDNSAQLPAGLEVVSLPDGYTYDAATGLLTRTGEPGGGDPCSYVTDPQADTSARFRTAQAVTSLTTQSLAPRIALCGEFFTYLVGAFEVTPSGQFLRTICRDCEGAATSITDTTLDGQTPYTLIGTARACQPQPCGGCEQQLLCDVPAVPTSSVPVTVTGRQVDDGQMISGAPRKGSAADGQAILTGQTVTVPNLADVPDAHALGVHTHYGALITPGAPVCGTLDPAGTVTITTTVTYTNDGPGRAWDWYGRLSMWNGAAIVAGAVDDFGGGSGQFFDPGQTRTSTITGTVPVAAWQAGQITLEFDLETGIDGEGETQGKDWTVTAGEVTAVAAVTDCPGPAVEFLRTICRDCDGTVTSVVDSDLSGNTYIPTGTIGRCDQSTDCASPTTPTTTVGLCLADGTPIAVVMTRDCSGVVTQDGWINLTTGAYSTGQPPTGTMACGDTESIQVSGTFCDVDASGDVVGLVLVEYTYAADGSIESVRLVNATTGTTYTPQGTVTVCPSGTAQPEQDLVVLCDVAANGTITAFTRDFRRDENGTIVGFSDYTLAGAAYTPVGTVGVCDASAEEIDHLQQVLCDTAADGSVTQFLRHWTVDNTTGALTAAGDTTLDGTTAYTPAGAVGACQPCARQIIERCGCDDTNSDGFGDVTFTELWAVDPCGGAAPELLGTYLDGDLTQPYTPVAPVECTTADQPPGPLSTGVRNVTGTATQNLAGAFPGLQSVSVTVLVGQVNATMSDGAAVPLPAGVTMTWSVAKEEDAVLGAASFAGATAAASYLLNWTYR
ncbi:hypothetical protein ABZ568_00470 [Streptomyces olindensis]|uniref:Uncharacterized protein n=1 Tax=Streptomyces olindensis TaxID=358823 RepID=A0ABV2XLS7_9ACTN